MPETASRQEFVAAFGTAGFDPIQILVLDNRAAYG